MDSSVPTDSPQLPQTASTSKEVDSGQQSKPKKGAKPAKANATQKLYAKQAARRIKTGLLPDPSLGIEDECYTSFVAHLKSSKRVIALLGAGLSAASGLATFRGAGSSWRGMDVMDLASHETWATDPVLVWFFYIWRRRRAMAAAPNRGHRALAALATTMQDKDSACELLAVNQNIDDLSGRAGHSAKDGLVNVHGSLFDFRCEKDACDYTRLDDYTEPLSPSLETESLEKAGLDLSDSRVPLPVVDREELPRCPKCSSLIRPKVVWFGEPLEQDNVRRIHTWFDMEPKVDLMLVIGTSAVVFPAAAYIYGARQAGARIAYFNPEQTWDDENPHTAFREDKDWWFKGSAAETLPEVLKEIIGVVAEPH